MQSTFSRNIFLMRLFRCIEQPYADRFVIDFYFSQPFAVFFSYAKKTAFVAWSWFTRVLSVFYVGNRTQIIDSIIRSVSINMVYLLCGPLTISIEPRQSMRQIQRVVQSKDNVTILGGTTRFCAYTTPTARFSPRKQAGVGGVVKKFFKPFWCHAVNINSAMCGGQA